MKKEQTNPAPATAQTTSLNYDKLMAYSPTIYDAMVNSLGQEIVFVEHPLKGDMSPIICVCHELKIAEYSMFWETDDMMADHGEYEPSFHNGKLLIGGFEL